MKSGDGRGPAIAIIGTAGRFPGADSVDDLWRVLLERRDTLSRLDVETLRAEGVPQAVIDRPDYVPSAAILQDFDAFDAEFFGLSARDAAFLDPQQRVFLETAWAALESAGYGRSRGASIGVWAGSSINTYKFRFWDDSPLDSSHTLRAVLAHDKDYLATFA